MKRLLLFTFIVMLCFGSAHALSKLEKTNLMGTWVLEGMSEKLKGGEMIPDGAFYEFTPEGVLNYEMNGFKQSGKYQIKGKKISTEAMGTYNVISIKSDEMILHYGGYMFFKRKE